MAVAGPTIVTTTTGTVSAGTTITISVTVLAGQRLLLAVTTTEPGGADIIPSSVVFNTSENFTELADTVRAHANGDTRTSFYWLSTPTVTTADVVVTYPGTVTDALAAVLQVSDARADQPLNTNTVESTGGARIIANIWSQQTASLVASCALKESGAAWTLLQGNASWDVSPIGVRLTGRWDKQVTLVAVLPDQTTGFFANNLLDTADQTASVVVIAGNIEDTQVDDDVLDELNRYRGLRTVWTTQSIGYVFFLNDVGLLQFRKSTDQGVTWTNDRTLVNPGTAEIMVFDIWYDRWNPGRRSETLIHIAFSVRSNILSSIQYMSLDVLDDSFTSTSLVDNALTMSALTNENTISIAKANGGVLYVAARTKATAPNQLFYQSANGGATWSNPLGGWGMTEMWSRVRLMPTATTDPDDILIVDNLLLGGSYRLNFWSNINNSWGTPVAFGSSASTTDYLQFAAVLRLSDKHTLVAHWNGFNNAAADLQVTDIGASTSEVTSLANVLTDQADAALAGIAIDDATNDIFVFYMLGTVDSSMDLFYRKSTDGGTTWGSAQPASELAGDHRHLDVAPCVIGADGGRIQGFWFNDDLNDIITEHTTGLICPELTALVPDIDVFIGLNEIADGATVALGETTLGNAINIQFFIVNGGSNSLKLGTLSVTGDGSIDAGDDPSDSFLEPLAEVTTTVIMDVSTLGAKSAGLVIPSNDPDENPYNITLTLTVVARPVTGVPNCTRFRCRMPGPGLRRDEDGFVNQP